MQTPEALSYNTTPIVTQLLPGANASLAGSSFPDLSAMMFPSADPFAYPNQPITTLENHDVIKQETGFESNECNAQSWPFYGTYNSADTPVFGTFPLYPHPDTTMQNTGPLLSMCDSADDSPAMMTNGPPGRWLEQQFGPSGVPDLNVDHIFREDWSSGWTDPGYGHGQ